MIEYILIMVFYITPAHSSTEVYELQLNTDAETCYRLDMLLQLNYEQQKHFRITSQCIERHRVIANK
jgi:hypothetical protein|tara:strand:- start:159 stop:359 length:201 start_codon:yes stop_codon:yes gene_type:complete